MKKAYLLLLSFVMVFSCNKDDSSNTITNETPGLTIMTNGTDPLLIRNVTKNNEIIEVYGKRDANGKPISVDYFTSTKDNKEQVYFLDEQSRPVEMLADNGTHFLLDWLDNESFALTVIAPNNINQINTIVNLNKSTRRILKPNTSIQKRNTPIKYTYKSITTTPNSNSKKAVNSITLETYSCGEKADVDKPLILVKREFNGEIIRSIIPDHVGQGEYVTLMPSGTAPSHNGNEICTDLANLVSNICSVGDGGPIFMLESLCVSLSGALIVSGIGTPEGILLLGACEGLIGGYELACTVFGIYQDAGHIDSFCNAEFLNLTITEDLNLIGIAKGVPNIYSNTVNAPGEGPYPIITIDLGSNTIINGFYITPSAPQNGQDYNVIARVGCIKAGSSVVLSIVGTDGYTDEITIPITVDDPLGEFTLSVPGAETGIQDTCTVKITLPNGSEIIKIASIIFG